MRYTVYAVLVVVGFGGLLAGTGLTSKTSADHEMLWLLIGVVALGAIAVVMAIEHATAGKTRRMLDILHYQKTAPARLVAGNREQPLVDL